MYKRQTQASLIGAILEREPPAVATTVPAAPPLLDRLVRKCLAKDPAARWQSAGDLVEILSWVSESPSSSQSTADAPPPVRPRPVWIALTVASALVAAAAIAAAIYLRVTAPEERVTILDVVTPPGGDPFSFALSPDGRQLVFSTSAGAPQLWLRPLDQPIARPLAGTFGGTYPFWSPDSRSIAFFADGRLKRLDIAGGGVEVLAPAPLGRGGSWGGDGTIVFAAGNGPLMRVPASGGTPAPATTLLEGQVSHRFPSFLPDGRHFLFSASLGAEDTRGIYVASLDGGPARRLIASDYAAQYAGPGYLFVASEGVLQAHPFDPGTLTLTGEPISIAPDVGISGMLGQAAFSVSRAGLLAYRRGGAGGRQLIWVDRSGKAGGVVGDIDLGTAQVELSPDGSRVIVTRPVQGNVDIWARDVVRGTMTRLTFDPSVDALGKWSPDGRQIAFSSARAGRFDLFLKPADGSAEEQPILTTPLDKAPLGWSPDGRFLLFAQQDPSTASDLWALPLSGERQPFPVVQTPFDEVHGQLSPDGRWLAYSSNESGRYEIYVTSFPDRGGKWQISTSGAVYPRWRHDGAELFFLGLDNRIMSASVRVTGTFSGGAPTALFGTQLAVGGNVGIGGFISAAEYDVARDGRFLLNVAAGDGATAPIAILQHWRALLPR